MSKAIAKQETGALANAADVRPWNFEGEDSDDFLVPRITIHQGDISQKKYGPGTKGTLIDTTTNDTLPSMKFSPIYGWKEWIKWGEKRGGNPEYRTRNKSDVPPEDLQWHDNEPPAATLTRNFAVLFDGMSTPVVISWKDSSKRQRTCGKLLNQLEKLRAAQNLGRGLYEIVVVEESNDEGDWKDWTIKPIGNPDDAMSKTVAQWTDALTGKTVQTNIEAAEKSEGFDPDKY